MPAFGFIGPAYQARGIAAESERLINLQLDQIQSDMGAARPTKFQFINTPGKTGFVTLPTSPIAGIAATTNVDNGPASFSPNPLFFAVGGDVLYAIEADTTVDPPVGSATVIGTVSSSVVPNTGGMLFPATIITLSPVQVILLTFGTLYLAGYGGSIITSALNSGGAGYAVGDTGGVQGGLITTLYTVTSVGGGGDVTGYMLTGGTGYSVQANVQTASGGLQPGSGAGFSIDISAVAADAWLVQAINGSPLAPAITIDTFVGSLTYLDGYCIANYTPGFVGARRKFQISGLNDPNIWNILDFGVKESNPDPIQSLFASNELLYLLGSQTMEVWQNTGNGLFPFQRLPGAGVLEIGIAALWPVCKMGQGMIFVGMDARGQYSAWKCVGTNLTRISNDAIENRWAKFNMNAATIYAYEEIGHQFAVFQFPNDDETWVYDDTIGPAIGWHQRASWDGSQFHMDIGRFHAFAPSLYTGLPMHAVGDNLTGDIYLQSMEYLTENCTAIRRIRTCPHLVDEKKRHFYQRFRMHMLTGKVGSSANPICSLRISKDGGQTYGNYLDMPIGMIGEYGKLVDWYVHFYGRDVVFEWSSSEPIDFCLIEAYIEHFAGAG